MASGSVCRANRSDTWPHQPALQRHSKTLANGGPSTQGRKIDHDDSDAIRFGIVRIGEIAHAMGEVSRGSVIGHLHMPPGFVRVDEDEHIGRAVALVFAIVSLG